MNNNYRNGLASSLIGLSKSKRRTLLELAKKREVYKSEKDKHLTEIKSFIEQKEIDEFEKLLDHLEGTNSQLDKPSLEQNVSVDNKQGLDLKVSSVKHKKVLKYKELLEKAGIIDLLESKGINFDEIIFESKENLQKKYGVAYIKIKELLIDLLKGNLSKEEINSAKDIIKNRLDIVMDVFFDKDVILDVGNHLRERQHQSVIKALNFILYSPNDTGYIHFPTASGKTVMFGDIIRNIIKQSPNTKIVITVPNKEALFRSKDEFEKIGLETGLFYGDEKDLSKNITIGTTHSLRLALNKGVIKNNTFDLMICDEAHEGYLGEKTSEFIESFICKKIGYTATPELRNKTVGELFKEEIDEYLVDEAILNKELPQIDSNFKLKIDNKEFEKLKVANGEFTQESLNKFDVRDTFPAILEAFKNGKLKGKQIAIFMPSVALSKELTEYLNTNGIISSHIDGKTKNRKELKDDFESRKTQVLISCDVLKSSWDSDVIDGVIVLRPILSPATYMQIIGRALHGKNILNDGRKTPKDEVMVVDINNSSPDIIARNITTDSINSIISLSGKDKDSKIKISGSDNISEILFYYDVKGYFTDNKIEELYKKFAELYKIELNTFLEKLDIDFINLYNENITLNIVLKSNNKFGEKYTGKERVFEIDLLVLKKLLCLYKINTKKIEKKEKNTKKIQIEEIKNHLTGKEYTIAGETYLEVFKNDKKFFVNKTTLKSLKAGLKYVTYINKQIKFLDKDYIEVFVIGGTRFINSETLETLKTKSGEFIESIGNQIKFLDENYIKVSTNKGSRFISIKSSEPLVINGELVESIGKQIKFLEKDYIGISTDKGHRFINPKTLEFLKTKSGDFIESIGKQTKFLGKDYIGVSTDKGSRFINIETLEFLKTKSGDFIEGIGEKRKFLEKDYILVSNNKGTCFIDIKTLEFLKTKSGDIIKNIGIKIDFSGQSYFEVSTDEGNVFINTKTLDTLKIQSGENVKKFGKKINLLDEDYIEVSTDKGICFINIKTLEFLKTKSGKIINSVGEKTKVLDEDYIEVSTDEGNVFINTKTGEDLETYSLEYTSKVLKIINSLDGYSITPTHKNNHTNFGRKREILGSDYIPVNTNKGILFIETNTLAILKTKSGEIIKSIGEKIKVLDEDYIEVSTDKGNCFTNIKTLEFLKTKSGEIIKSIGEKTKVLDEDYIEVSTDKGICFINIKTLEYLKTDSGKIIKSIGKQIKVLDKDYIEVSTDKGGFVINPKTLEYLKTDSGEFINSIGKQIKILDEDYIEIFIDKIAFVVNAKTLKPLDIKSGELIKNIGKRITISNYEYFEVESISGNRYLIDTNNKSPLIINSEFIIDILNSGEYVEAISKSGIYLLNKVTLEPIKIDSIFVSKILETKTIGNKKYKKLQDEKGKSLFIDSNNKIIFNNSGYRLIDIEDKKYGYSMFIYEDYKALVNENGDEIILSNGDKISNLGELITGHNNLINITSSSGTNYIYDLSKKDLVTVGDCGILKKIIKKLENGKLLIETTRNKELIVDNSFNPIYSNGVYIKNNLDDETEYMLGGVSVKNVIYSDNTSGLVNARTYERVLLKVGVNIITSVISEKGLKKGGIFTVELDNGDEIEVTSVQISIVQI